MNSLTTQDWINVGYRRHNQKFKESDYLVQKLFNDDLGKRYYLTVYVYENFTKNYYENYRGVMSAYSFMPDVQFLREGGLRLNIQVIMNDDNSIAEVEQQIESLWVLLGKPYYEMY